MRHRLIRVSAALAVIAVPVLSVAEPAGAADGPPVVGCTTGSSCSVQLNYSWTTTGSTGGKNPVTYTPPPCIGVPVGDAYAGSQVIITIYGASAPLPAPGTTSPAPSTPATSPPASASPSGSPSGQGASGLTPQEQQIYAQAQQLLNTKPKPAGEWYQIAGNPAASAGDQQVCSQLPPYVFAVGGRLPNVRGVNVPPETLAAYAYSRLKTADVVSVAFNPQGTSDTNLPTFVNMVISLPRRAPGLLEVAGPGSRAALGAPFVYATAMTPNGTSATVYAWVKGFNISINPGSASSSATVFNDPRCSTVSGTVALPKGRTGFRLGSRYSLDQMAKVGVGQQIDCGVTFTAPGTYTLTVSVSWDACWSTGQANPVGPPAYGCNPVPGAGGLQDSIMNPPPAVNVREIQSVNGSPSPLPA